MKVALFIFRFGPSHGSILQTYALTRTLENMGHKVTIIDRQKPVSLNDFYLCLRRVAKGLLNGRFSWHDFYLGSFSKHVMKNLNKFLSKELWPQTITIRTEKDLQKIGRGDYDAFIVGSDQTWRPKYVYNIYNYFLDFVPEEREVKRIAYAVSFGTSEWEYLPDQELKCKVLASRFDGVSVREEDGVRMCKKFLNIDSTHVLDPTLLLKRIDYLRLVSGQKQCEDKCLGYNFLDFSTEKMEMVGHISAFMDLPVRQINSMTENPAAKASERVAPSIEEWLCGIANSQFVIVDSFHATVFAIIFHKEFITIGNERRGLSRFKSLLKITGLEDRLVSENELLNEELFISNIDWDEVDSKIANYRDRSLSFLQELLGI
jgi:polysaccharide pyruvyl transferase WcaK-like protein